MPTRTARRSAMYGPLFTDTVLDDPIVTDDDAVSLGRAWLDAVTSVKHDPAPVPHHHDRWRGDNAEVYAFVTAHPHF